ncbi:CYP59 [Scenedesmus sp. PABB004]|nr:CYP59 [Scenedesmus sp. PABB004]
MAVLLETSKGDLVVDLFVDEAPTACKNFLKLCKIKYYNNCLFHNVQRNFIAQTGDPSGTGKGGDSVFGLMYGGQARFFDDEITPKRKHEARGCVGMASAGPGLNASQFYITLGDALDSLDERHTLFGRVSEGLDVLEALNEAPVDGAGRPLQNIRIRHTILLDDPFDDPPQLADLVPDASPPPTFEHGDRLEEDWVPAEDARPEEEVEAEARKAEAANRAVVLEMIGDLPEADAKPPSNMLFVCKLNPVTTEEDLEIIFGRFGTVTSCDIIRDFKTGDSLCYGFVGFDGEPACEAAYFKMNNVLVDDRRIKVDFSQSVSHIWRQFKRAGKAGGDARLALDAGGGPGGGGGGRTSAAAGVAAPAAALTAGAAPAGTAAGAAAARDSPRPSWGPPAAMRAAAAAAQQRRAAGADAGAAGARQTVLARRSGARGRCAIVARGVRKAKQGVPRRELQQAAKHEYLKQFYESADRVEADHLVYELKPASPRLRAEQDAAAAAALAGRGLAARIPAIASWAELDAFLEAHGAAAHFGALTALAGRAAALAGARGAAPPPDGLLPRLGAALLGASSWFQASHFAAVADAMRACGLADAAFWDELAAAAEHKVGALSFPQLTTVLCALATVGFTPPLEWVERSYRQAAKHLHAADPRDVCGVMWAWGEMGYTPRDRLFINQVKIITRRAFDAGRLSGPQLARLAHGLARMPRYAPNAGWLAALARQAARRLDELAPETVVDLLLSLLALGFQPTEAWTAAALGRVAQGFGSAGDGDGNDAVLLLELPDPLRTQQGPAGVQAPGLLADGAAAGDAPNGAGPRELAQLAQLFDDAAEAEALGEGEADGEAAAAAAAAAAESGQPLSQPAQAGAGDGPAQPDEQPPLSAEQLGVLCWCLGRLSRLSPPHGWTAALARELLRQCGSAPAEVVVDVLLGLVATRRLPVGALQAALLARALELVPSMGAEQLRRLCIALADLEGGLKAAAAADAAAASQQQRAPEPAPAPVAAAQAGGGGGSAAARGGARRRSRCGGRSEARDGGGDAAGSAAAAGGAAAWLAAFREQHKAALAEAVTHRQGIILWQSSTAQLADVLAFVAASGLKPSAEFLATGVGRAVDKLPAGAPAPAVVTLLWALARLGFKPHPALLHALLAALQRGLHLLSSRQLADAGWALCTLKHRPGAAWLGVYMQQVASKAGLMEQQALTDTLWALACFAAQPDREWLKRAAGAAARAGLSRRNAAVVVWALQQLGFDALVRGGAEPGGELEGAVSALAALVAQPEAGAAGA